MFSDEIQWIVIMIQIVEPRIVPLIKEFQEDHLEFIVSDRFLSYTIAELDKIFITINLVINL